MYKIFLAFLFLLSPAFLNAWELSEMKMQNYYHPMRTKEEFYSLYRENLTQKTSNFNANIFWLEHAKKAPFDHPVKALAKIESEVQWKQYQKLFLFHMDFLIMKNYILLAEQFDKPNLLFFNNPFKEELKEGYQMAQIYYNRAKIALTQALKLADLAWETREDTPLSLDGEVDKWADMVYKIKNTSYYHEVNYEKEIAFRLKKVATQIEKLS